MEFALWHLPVEQWKESASDRILRFIGCAILGENLTCRDTIHINWFPALQHPCRICIDIGKCLIVWKMVAMKFSIWEKFAHLENRNNLCTSTGPTWGIFWSYEKWYRWNFQFGERSLIWEIICTFVQVLKYTVDERLL